MKQIKRDVRFITILIAIYVGIKIGHVISNILIAIL